MTRKTNELNVTFIIVAAIIGFSILGYALISRQTKLDIIKEQDRTEKEALLKQEEQEAEKEVSRTRSLRLCLSSAELDMWDRWSLNCETSGSHIERNEDGEITSCNLPTHLADAIHADEQKEKDRDVQDYINE